MIRVEDHGAATKPRDDVVVFDTSGSMGAGVRAGQRAPIAVAVDHALERFGADARWHGSIGDENLHGRLGDIDGRPMSLGGPSLTRAIADADAPGTRLTVYTDDVSWDMDEAFAMLEGRDATIVVVGRRSEPTREIDVRLEFVDAD